MLDELKNGEQLSSDYTTSATGVGFDNLSYGNHDGSPIDGKFKTVDELIKAYESLQSEFTKKCQALSELKKNNESDNAPSVPPYENSDWQEKVDEFLLNHPLAKKFSREISEIISSDKVLGGAQNSLEVAYGKVLEKENEKLNNRLNDNEFAINSLSDSDKEKIVKDYLKKVSLSPNLMTSKGGNTIASSYKKPTTVFEAGEMAKKIFK